MNDKMTAGCPNGPAQATDRDVARSRSVKSGNTVVIVVIVIIAIVVVVGLGLIVLGTLFVANFSGVVSSNDKEKSARIQLQAVGKALELYEIDMNSYPDQKVGLKALEERPEGSLNWSGPYLAKGVPKDPWGGQYFYALELDEFDQQVFKIWSAGPNKKDENGEDGTDDIVVYSDR